MTTDPSTEHGLRVLAADEDAVALDATAEILRSLGHEVTSYAVGVDEAAQQIAAEDPDLAIVVLHGDRDHALELIDEISEYASGPVIALTETDDPSFISAAAERGIFAYARDASPDAVQGAIAVAVRRHAETRRLAEQVDQLENALLRRSLIERAKGILMERHGVDDREAFKRLRDYARSRNMTVVAVSQAVADGHGLLPKQP